VKTGRSTSPNLLDDPALLRAALTTAEPAAALGSAGGSRQTTRSMVARSPFPKP